MAGFTSRILFSLTIPSVFGFLSILWFLKRRNSKSIKSSKAIQVEEDKNKEAVESHNLYPVLEPMKLKGCDNVCSEADFAENSSEMQLKETDTAPRQMQNGNGVSQNNMKKGKKKTKSKPHENGTSCLHTEAIINGCAKAISSGTPEDNPEKLANGIEALSISKNNSHNEDTDPQSPKIMTCTLTEVTNGSSSVAEVASTECDQLDVPQVTESKVENGVEATLTNGVHEDAKEQSKTDSPQVFEDTNCDKVPSSSTTQVTSSENQTDAHKLLTLPVDECSIGASQGDMLESPGAKYCDSVGSNDSGKGGSEFQFVLEQPTFYMVYEFEILQELCGLLIGRNGRHVNYIKQETNANILIKRHPFFHHMKVCCVTGTEDEIHAALKFIRKRFPVEVYPTVTLSQINAMPIGFQSPESLKLCLPEGVSFETMLCATVNAGHFFLQQPTHPTFHSLPALNAQMNDVYSQVETPTLSHVAKGYVCVACLSNGWYRAEIDEVLEDTDECRLKFLDYGGYAVVPRSALRQIRYDFMNVPFQATECYLGSVTYREGEDGWSAEATAAFEELAQGQIVQGCIVGYAENRIPYVHLYKITGINSVFINRELVIRDLARWSVMPH